MICNGMIKQFSGTSLYRVCRFAVANLLREQETKWFSYSYV